MKQLIILCHPLAESLSQAIGRELSNLYEKYKVEAELRDLYEINFNPILSKEDLSAKESKQVLEDVRIEQAYISDADLIVFVYPVWYSGMPAMLKGYVERVFTEGFAFSLEENGVKKLLAGKTVILVNTYKRVHKHQIQSNFVGSLMASDKSLFESFGMNVILHYFLENIEGESKQERQELEIKNFKSEIKKALILNNNARLNIPNVFL